MTGAAAPLRAPRFTAVTGLVALLALALWGWFAPAPVLHGWLVGFVFAGGLAFGCFACLMVHRLTGGRWGEASRPAFLAGALTLPLLIPLGAPLVLFARHLYPWAADPETAGEGVAEIYLNPALLSARSLLVVGLLSLLAFRTFRGRLGRFGAGVALLIYAVGLDVSAYDWVLSLDPRFTSSAIGMQLIVQHFASGFALALLLLAAPASDRAWSDLAGLGFAAVLGELYLGVFTFTIEWYGDRPDQAAYYLDRAQGGWWLVVAAATLLGACMPLGALMFGRLRHDPVWLKRIAGLALAGLLTEDIWLVAPHAGPLAGSGGAAALASLLATFGMAGIMAAAAGRIAAQPELAEGASAPTSRPKREVPHGV